MSINLVVPRIFKESENVGDKVCVCVCVCVCVYVCVCLYVYKTIEAVWNTVDIRAEGVIC